MDAINVLMSYYGFSELHAQELLSEMTDLRSVRSLAEARVLQVSPDGIARCPSLARAGAVSTRAFSPARKIQKFQMLPGEISAGSFVLATSTTGPLGAEKTQSQWDSKKGHTI